MLERIITALVLVAVVLSCMFATQSHYPMFILMILAAGVAGYEWFKLMPHGEALVSKPKAWIYGGCVAAVSTLALFFDDVALLLWAASILTWLGSIYWVKNFPESDNWYNVSLYAIGFILISAAVTALYSVWHSSPWWLMYLFLLVWGRIVVHILSVVSLVRKNLLQQLAQINQLKDYMVVLRRQ
jgi:phosphatidate cytidylyltransferase